MSGVLFSCQGSWVDGSDGGLAQSGSVLGCILEEDSQALTWIEPLLLGGARSPNSLIVLG